MSIQDNTTKLQELLEKANTLPESLDTSDATATAEDMAKGVTAYVKGEKVTGEVVAITGTESHKSFNSTPVIEDDYITLSMGFGVNRLYRKQSVIKLGSKLENFGDATPEDVAEGKTFTSASGLKVTGTHKCSNGYAIKTGTTTSATIDTGLSSVKQFIIYKTTCAETGLIQGTYNADLGTSYAYCSSYSTYSKRYAIGNTAPTINDGIVNWGGENTQGLSSGKTYNWIAIGEE